MTTDNLHSERLLFQRIAEDDAHAFAVFFDAHALKLIKYVARFLNSDLWAEEIVQDVFIKLWNIRYTLKEIEYPSAFLYRMAANRTKNHLLRHQREVKMQYYLASQYVSASSTQDQIDYRIGEQLFQEAVQQLPQQRALIFKLRHEQGLGYQEIAHQLGLSKNTVRNQLNLALQNIRNYLLEHGDIGGYIIFFFATLGT